MKVIVALSLALLGHVTAEQIYRPTKLSYADLTSPSSSSSLLEALTTVGLVSITNIPNYPKPETLGHLHDCALTSSATQQHTFADGTLRRTMATHTVPGGVQTIFHGDTSACQEFDTVSKAFRSTVAEVTQTFAQRLAESLNLETPLLVTRDGEYSFDTIQEVVENGEHLEHFHSYQKLSQQEQEDEETIKLHTDQGLFIAFTPGMMVQKDATAKTLASGFYIELQDGSLALVQFDEQDDLVFMLGDGVNQYVNTKCHQKKLVATPHSLAMPVHSAEEVRVWYGRMVLPPASAVHPKHGKTFGDMRQNMIHASLSNNSEEEEHLRLGCSSSMMTARQLEQTSCEAGTLYCWHRCMSLEEQSVSEEICASQGLDLACINPRSQVWGSDHGDYYPGCVDLETAEPAGPYPTLPQYPRDDAACTEDMFRQFAMQGGPYDHTAQLAEGAMLMWTVNGDQLNARIAYDGLFGFLAMGFPSTDGMKNGMHGATILMALPGGNYSPVDGLDLTMGPTVDEYIINPNGEKAAFRHWMEPVSSTSVSASRAVPSSSVSSNECFTAMSFTRDSIHNIKFNLIGTDDLIWAANGVDYYAGYHTARGRVTVDWTTGQISNGNNEEGVNKAGAETTSGAVSAIFGWTSFFASAVAMLMF